MRATSRRRIHSSHGRKINRVKAGGLSVDTLKRHSLCFWDLVKAQHHSKPAGRVGRSVVCRSILLRQMWIEPRAGTARMVVVANCAPCSSPPQTPREKPGESIPSRARLGARLDAPFAIESRCWSAPRFDRGAFVFPRVRRRMRLGFSRPHETRGLAIGLELRVAALAPVPGDG